MQKATTHQLGVLLVLISALMFGSYGVWSRLIGDDFGNFFQGWTRALLVFAILLPIVWTRKELVPIKREDWGWLSVFLVFTSLTQAPIFYAFNHMDIGSASLLFFVSQFLTMYLVGIIFLSERLTVIRSISIVLAIIGMYLVFSFSVAAFVFLAALMALLNGVASGGEISFSKKLSGKYSPLYLVALSWFVIFITNAITSLWLGETQVALAWSEPWLWQLCFSLASLFGFWLVIAGFKYVEAGIGALVGLMEIVFGILFGVLIFQETISTSVGAGALLIITASALPSLYELIVNRPKTRLG